jgi:drug/metabolite transporter (DMT)-like permease
MAPSLTSRQHTLRGILYMCATTIVLFPLLNASVKYLGQQGYPLAQIVFMRSVVHLLWMMALFMPARGWRIFISARPGLQMARSALQLIALVCYITALLYIPLTTATGIAFVAPLLVVGLSVIMLGEKVGPRRWAAVGVGFAGALVIIRPGGEVFHPANILILVSALSYALYQILTRRVAADDDYRVSAVYTILLSLIGSSFFVGFVWRTPANGIDWAVFLGLGLIGGFGHFFMIRAYEHAEASVIGPLDYGQLIGATLLGFFLFQEFPDLWTWIGAGIIVASGIYIARREAVVKRAKIKS